MPVTKTSGQGRPKGVLNKATAEIKALAQVHGPAIIERLARLSGILVDENGEPIKGAESEATQAMTMKELLDRGYGKATQIIAGDDDAPLTINLVKFGDRKPTE